MPVTTQHRELLRDLLITALISHAIALAAIGVSLWLGWIGEDRDINTEFGERDLATFTSVGFLIVCGIGALRTRRRTALPRLRRFWLVFAFAFFLVATDDLVQLHERIDFAIHDLIDRSADDPLTDHLDDAIVLLYPLAVAGFALPALRELLRLRWFVAGTMVGAVLFVCMAVCDLMLHVKWIEESFKILSAAWLLIGIRGAFIDPQLRAAPAA